MTNDLVKYRENPLTEEDFHRLEDAAEKVLVFKRRYAVVIAKERDEYGDPIEKRDYMASGYEIFPKGEISQKLVESLCRPPLPRNLGVRLKNLESHKPFGRGMDAWRTIIGDLCKDLADVSEFAVIKICENYRLDHTTKFFPSCK